MKKRLLILLLFSIGIFCLSSCKNSDHFNTQEYGDWLYTTINNYDNCCSLIGLSEEGKKKDTIIIPATLNSFTVCEIGKSKGYWCSPDIVFDNASKLYARGDIGPIQGIKCGEQQISIYIAELDSMAFYYCFKDNINARFYVSKEIYYSKFSMDLLRTTLANIEYQLDGITYFCDYVESGAVNEIPPTPVDTKSVVTPKPLGDRKEFDGWYLNDVKWDFNNSVDEYIKDDNRLILIGKWK